MARFDRATFSGKNTWFDRARFSGESVAFESPRAWNNVTFEWDYPGRVTCPNVSTLVSGHHKSTVSEISPDNEVFGTQRMQTALVCLMALD